VAFVDLVSQRPKELSVRFTGQYDVNHLQNLILTYHRQQPVYLSDIATVVLAQHGLRIELSYDASVHIRNAIDFVQSNLGLGVILALMILWGFLRGIKATLIIATTIPVSVLVAIIALDLFGRSLNVVSLAGLAFSVGLVLDAAIIVQENIMRIQRASQDIGFAVRRGTTQVTVALMASTATSVAIFLPILFMGGVEGQLFSDLALTLSVAVICSFVSAITLIPVATRYFMPNYQQDDPLAAYWQTISKRVMQLTHGHRRQRLWILMLLGGTAGRAQPAIH
jgi:multidrug efflux pump subunit AcrB